MSKKVKKITVTKEMREASKKPSRLPRGIKEFNAWADEVIALADAPNNDSIKFALAVQVLHSNPDEDSVPKQVFVKRLNKGMSNQVVSQVINDLKAKQAEEEQKAKSSAEQKQLEATASQSKASDNEQERRV